MLLYAATMPEKFMYVSLSRGREPYESIPTTTRWAWILRSRKFGKYPVLVLKVFSLPSGARCGLRSMTIGAIS